MEAQGIVRHLFQAYAADARLLRAEIRFKQILAKPHRLEDLCAAIRANGRDAHFRHNLIQALAQGLDVVGLGRLVIHLHLAAPHEVVEHGKRHVGIDGTRAVAQEQGGVHHLAYFAALHDECGLHALLHRNQMMMHGAHGKQRGDGGVGGVDAAVGKNDIVHAILHRLRRLLAKVVEREAHGLLGVVGVGVEEHGQFDGLETLVTDIAENVELAVVEHGVRQAHHFAMRLVGQENVHAHRADVFRERHDEFLAYGVDGGVGHLRELLPEVVEQELRLAAEHCRGRVVAHRCHRLCAAGAHRHERALHVLSRKSEGREAQPQVAHGVFHLTPAFQGVEFDAVGREPAAVGLGLGKAFLNFLVAQDFSLERIDEQDFARLQPSFLLDFRCLVGQHARLGGNHELPALSDEVAGGAQAVAVEHAAGIASVAEEQGGRAVPRFHKDRMVFVESFEVFANRIFIVKALRHEHRHGVGQAQPRHHEKLQGVVERSRVAHAGLQDGAYVLHVAEAGRGEHGLARLHPAAVATYGVDFAVVRQEAEGLREAPRGERVGGKARVHHRQAAREVGLRKVGEVSAHLHRREHTFIYYCLRRERHDVAAALLLRAALGLFAHNVEAAFQFVAVGTREKHLADGRFRGARLYAEHVGMHRHLAHMHQCQAFPLCFFGEDFKEIRLAQFVFGQKYKAGAIPTFFGHGNTLEEDKLVRYLNHDACAVACLVVCTLCASMLHVFEDTQGVVYQFVRLAAVNVYHHAHAASIVLVGGVVKSGSRCVVILHEQ